MKTYLKNPKWIWLFLIIGFVFVFFSMWQINSMTNRLRKEEQRQVELWAKAISQKSEIVQKTKDLYIKTIEDERQDMQKFVEAYKIIISQPEDVELTSPEFKFYTDIITDNKTIPVIITDEFNNIQFSQNIDIPEGQNVLVGDLFKRFSVFPPFEYTVYGMKFRLFYAESEIYENLKDVLDQVIYTFISEVTDNSISIPVIITDFSQTKILAYGNMDSNQISPANYKATLSKFSKNSTPIKIALPMKQNGYIFYEKDTNITMLKYYPYLYTFVFLLFVFLVFQSLRAMKMTEQNFLWTGMSKETAHQLGTPISSLFAWIELLKANPDNQQACEEMNKDAERLKIVSQRFSQIGSKPTLKSQDIIQIINDSVAYIQHRSPKNINFITHLIQDKQVLIPCSRTLIEWSFENIFKNAIDAMEGSGTITLNFEEDKKKIYIDIIDTGKGLQKKQFKKIFKPGYTTKKRGWGFGLSLVKRIIEDYHKGKIYVKSSVVGQGTVFRIEFSKTK